MQDHAYHSLNDTKVKVSLRKDSIWGHPDRTGEPKKLFRGHIQPPSPFQEAIAVMFQMGSATARVGGKPWHFSCGAGSARLQNARLSGS